MKPDADQPGERPQVIIRYPRLKSLHQDITECWQLSKETGEPHCMALEGHTGAGKTWLVRDYAALYPRVSGAEGDEVPIFYLLMPSPATIKGTARTMLAALGGPGSEKGAQTTLDARLVGLLRDCGVQLVILDDFHHLIDSDSLKVLHRVASWLKALIKQTDIPFLVVGIEGEVARVLSANPELSRLFAVRETLQPFDWEGGNPGRGEAFGRFVDYAEQVVGLSLERVVGRNELLWRLHYATGGLVAYLMQLLRAAAYRARRHGALAITLETLENAFDKRLAKPFPWKVNPFRAAHGVRFIAPPAPLAARASDAAEDNPQIRPLNPRVSSVLTAKRNR